MEVRWTNEIKKWGDFVFLNDTSYLLMRKLEEKSSIYTYLPIYLTRVCIYTYTYCSQCDSKAMNFSF